MRAQGRAFIVLSRSQPLGDGRMLAADLARGLGCGWLAHRQRAE
jgi:hypothetical protein